MEYAYRDEKLDQLPVSNEDYRSRLRSSENNTESRLKFEGRERWGGVLTQGEIDFCRRHDIELGYDCAQQGWVVLRKEEQTANFSNKMHSNTSQLSEPVLRSPVDVAIELAVALREEFERRDMLVDSADGVTMDKILQYLRRVDQKLSASGDLITAEDRLYCRDQLLGEVGRLVKSWNMPSKPVPFQFQYRPWHDADADAYTRILGDETVWQYLPEDFPGAMDGSLAKDFIYLANASENSNVFAIERNGEVVGQIRVLFSDSSTARSAEIAYILDPQLWGQGLMKQILKDFERFSFLTYGVDYLYLWIHPDNAASVKVAEYAGFVREQASNEKEISESASREGFNRYIRFSFAV